MGLTPSVHASGELVQEDLVLARSESSNDNTG